MLRRTGFRRNLYCPPPAAPPRRAERSGAITRITGDIKSDPKTVAHRNRALLDLARGMPCLLRIPGVCQGGSDTTVACHSNWGIHGKSGARKADDEYSCWGCAACHRWLDQGAASVEEKVAAFMAGHRLQVREWELIAMSGGRSDRDRAAARWALALLYLDAAGTVVAEDEDVLVAAVGVPALPGSPA